MPVEVSDVMATIFAPFIHRVARRNLEAEAQGLKRRCKDAAALARGRTNG